MSADAPGDAGAISTLPERIAEQDSRDWKRISEHVQYYDLKRNWPKVKVDLSDQHLN
jgi:hypothetical protein